MHIYLRWGTKAPQVKMIIQVIVPLSAHYGTSYNLMETLLKIIWYVHIFWKLNGFFRTEKTMVLPLPFLARQYCQRLCSLLKHIILLQIQCYFLSERSEVVLLGNKSIYVTNIQKWKLTILADNVAY